MAADAIWLDRPGFARASLAILGVSLVGALSYYLFVAQAAIRFPFGIEYGEGIVWYQMRLIVAGRGYAPLAPVDSIVFHYPPLYHFAGSLTARLTGLGELGAGRLVSVASAIATCGLIAAIAPKICPPVTDRRARRTGSALAGLMALSTAPLFTWSILFRVDLLFLALSFAGAWFGIRALTRPGAIYVAALLFVAAIFTKQTALAAPAAVFGTLLWLRPRTALAGIATCLLVGSAALALLEWQTHGGFLRHIAGYNLNRLDPGQIIDILVVTGQHFGYLIGAVWTIRARLRSFPGPGAAPKPDRLRRHLQGNASDAAFVMVLAYLALTSLMLPLAMKSGAAINYFLEWCCLLALFCGLGLVELAEQAQTQPRDIALPATLSGRIVRLFPFALAIQCVAVAIASGQDFIAKRAARAELAQLYELVGRASRPVISDDMAAVVQSGKPVVFEPSIFAELAGKAQWDERPFIATILAGRYAVFVTEGRHGDGEVFDTRYNPAVFAAIDRAYPVERSLAGYTLHFPAAMPKPLVARPH